MQASGTFHYKSIFFSPAATFVNSTLWLAFGTGERDNVAFTGEIGKDEDNNRFYVVSDTDPFETNAPHPILSDWDLFDMTGLDRASITGRGRDGEKWVTNTEIFAGLVITGSFTPEDTGDPCTSRGSATLYVFDILTGEGYAEPTIARVQEIVRKWDLGRDAEVQALEDALCLVFLETQFHDLTRRLEPDKLLEVTRKTLRKMSSRAVELTAQLPLDPQDRAYIERAAHP